MRDFFNSSIKELQHRYSSILSSLHFVNRHYLPNDEAISNTLIVVISAFAPNMVFFIQLIILSMIYIDFDARFASTSPGLPASVFIIMLFTTSTIFVTFGLCIWRIGKWLRSTINQHWEKQTPPFEPTFSRYDDISYASAITFILPNLSRKGLQPKDVNRKTAFRMGITQIYLIGFFLFTAAGIVLVFLNNSSLGSSILTMESYLSTPNRSISLLAATFSVLLGPVFGLLALGSVSIAQTASDFVLIALLLTPLIYTAPGVRNLSAYFSQVQHDWLQKTGRLADVSTITGWKFIILWAFTIVSNLLLVYIFTSFLSGP